MNTQKHFLTALAIYLISTCSSKVNGDLTKDILAVAKDCKDFWGRCFAGCKRIGGSSPCGRQAGTWDSVTRCNCPEEEWTGVREPRRHQSDTVFFEQLYNAHNTYRTKHHAPPLTVDQCIAAYASKYAKHLASIDKMVHSKNISLGENLATSSGTVEGQDSADWWYEEIDRPGYDFKKPTGFTNGTGHFTQLVWKDTKSVGCGRATNLTSNNTYVVCNYLPPGNLKSTSAFQANVLPE